MTSTERSRKQRDRETPEEHAEILSARRDEYNQRPEFVARRRKRYDTRKMDLFLEQRERAAKTFVKYYGHPLFNKKTFDENTRQMIADIADKSYEDVEGVEVWGHESLFGPYGQTRYAVDEKTGEVDKTNILQHGKSDYVDAMMTKWHSELDRVEHRTCYNCFEWWFHMRDSDKGKHTEPCYIKCLDKKRVADGNFKPTPEERKHLIAECSKTFPNEIDPSSERTLMIANLVELNYDSKHLCSECTHGTPGRVKKYKMTATKRKRVYSRFNLTVPPPGPLAQLKLTDEEDYILSLCVVAMRIENRLNDSNRPNQSKRTGHACILPLEFAHTYADYISQDTIPRARDTLLFYGVIQEGKNQKIYPFRVNAVRMQQTLAWRITYNSEYHDVQIHEDILNDYHKNPEVHARVVHLDESEVNADDTNIDSSVVDATFDEPQDHDDNEIVRVSHHGASEGVEHVNTAAEQALLNETEQQTPTYGFVSAKTDGRLSKVAMKKLLDVRNEMQCKLQEHKEASDDECSSDDSDSTPHPPPLNIKQRAIKPINEFEREVAWLVRASGPGGGTVKLKRE